MATVTAQVAEAFKEGIIACRAERWRDGYALLSQVSRETAPETTLPSVFYSYLGLSMAHCEGRREEALNLCRYALRLDLEEAENHLNLARIYLMLRRRKSSLRALRNGLRLSPYHRRLRELERQLGIRRPPVLPFLSRANPLNHLLGLARARFQEWLTARREQRLEEQALELLE
ncbi:MAG: hypothetical protein KDD11_17570 [Acidobacteria bacterium]|nr:hypothetical protein [Acidobacteriota bacterium]